MPAPTVRFYNITSGGNGLIQQLSTSGSGAGPQGSLVTTEDFGQVIGGSWDVKTILIGFDGNTADNLGFWLYNAVSNLQNWESGSGNWAIRARVGVSYISSFSDAAITSSPWVDLPFGSGATPWDLKSAIVGLNPGNDGTTNLLTPATNLSGVNLINAFLYLAIKPDPTAVTGLHTGTNYRVSFVWP